MSEAAVVIESGEERIVVTRDLRVLCGEPAEVKEIAAGEPWPADAQGRLDVLIRTGYVVRFEPDGSVDPRSARFAKRLGVEAPRDAPTRAFYARAAALAQTIVADGRRLRVFAGRPDEANADVFVLEGRAFGLFRGRPDDAAALEASRGGGPRRRAATGKRRRRRKG